MKKSKIKLDEFLNVANLSMSANHFGFFSEKVADMQTFTKYKRLVVFKQTANHKCNLINY